TPDDALWLVTAEAVPQRGDARALGEQLRTLAVSPRRLDLGEALALAGQVLAAESRPGEVVLISDLQASAVSPAELTVPLAIGRPADPPPANAGIARLGTGPQPWSSEGGRVVVAVAGDSGAPVPVTTRIGERPARQALAHAGGAATLALPGVSPGWWIVEAELAPDELRLDDRRVGVVRVAPVARAAWDSASRFVAAAGEVLASNRRVARGDEVTIGRLARGASIIQPPEDAAAIGALNRALAARGVAWSYGAPSVEPAATDSGPVLGRVRVLRRYRLQHSGSGRTGVLATVAGEPWLVRSGDVLLIGSRLDPAWTELPVSAGFMPFMDALLNRLARGEVTVADGAPGDPVPIPDDVTTVRQGEREWPVEGGGFFRPADVGAYYLLAGGDTVGAITANLDPRESLLAPADDRVGRLWDGARLADLSEVGGFAFSAGARGDLRGPILWAALALALVELGLASAWRRQR
nr:hypothetical protein [Gemmatimonadales bacterium]